MRSPSKYSSARNHARRFAYLAGPLAVAAALAAWPASLHAQGGPNIAPPPPPPPPPGKFSIPPPPPPPTTAQLPPPPPPVDPNAPKYTFTDLGQVEQVASDQHASLNNKGAVVVWRSVGSEGFRPVVLDKTGKPVNVLDVPKGFDNAFAYHINDKGTVVGWTNDFKNPIDSMSNTHAYLYKAGKAIDLGTLGGKNSHAYSVNNGDIVVGVSDTPDKHVQYGFRYDGHKMQVLDPLPGGNNSVAFGVNAAGVAVGNAVGKPVAGGVRFPHAVLWKDHTPMDLGVLTEGRGSVAYAINNHNDVVGVGDVGPDQDVFLYTKGKISDLGFVGRAFSINDNGQIVGTRETGERTPNAAWIFQNGKRYDLNDCVADRQHFNFESALEINASGQIVANALLARKVHVVLLNPVAPVKPVAKPVVKKSAAKVPAAKKPVAK